MTSTDETNQRYCWNTQIVADSVWQNTNSSHSILTAKNSLSLKWHAALQLQVIAQRKKDLVEVFRFDSSLPQYKMCFLREDERLQPGNLSNPSHPGLWSISLHSANSLLFVWLFFPPLPHCQSPEPRAAGNAVCWCVSSANRHPSGLKACRRHPMTNDLQMKEAVDMHTVKADKLHW